MVARVLIINEHRHDVSKISSELQSVHNAVLLSKSIEDSIRVIGTQGIDIVFVSLPQRQSKLFFDFFSVLRQTCGIIPIIGFFDRSSPTDISQFLDIGLDDIIDISIAKNALIRKANVLVRMKNMFDESLLGNMFIREKEQHKIVTVFHESVDFLHRSILDSSEIVSLRSWPTIDKISDADLFIVNFENRGAVECCANLRLRRENKYKPIVITYCDNSSKLQAKRALEMRFICTDVLNISSDNISIAFRINSLIRYKKLYEDFSRKLKKSIYLSAIDATTEVYNRSFFEDYIKNKESQIGNSAIIMIDVDKFKTVNDKFGHSFADSMLKYISGTIKNYVRSSDIIARYGGDEFIIIMENVSSSMVTSIANRIKRTIENSPFNNTKCTVSIGICCIDNRERINIHDAISIADKFMYMAKQDGGNSVKICA